MKHWHRCERWTRRGVDCPFGAAIDHDEDSAPEDDDSAPFPMVPVPGRRPTPAARGEAKKRGRRRTGQLGGAPGIPKIEDMVEEVLRDIPELDDPEPFPLPAPPLRPPQPEPGMPPAPVPVPVPAPPMPVPAGRPVGLRPAVAAQRAVSYLYQGARRTETVYSRQALARGAEEAAAKTFAEPRVPEVRPREPRRLTRPRAGGARPRVGRSRRGGYGGFMFNAAAEMQALFGFGSGFRVRPSVSADAQG